MMKLVNTSKKMTEHRTLLGYNVMLSLPREYKDWNDELVNENKK